MPSNGYTRFVPYVLVIAVLVLVGFNSLRGNGGESASGASFVAAGNATGAAGTSIGGAGSGVDSASGLSISSSTQALVVDVAGGVVRPGVYRLPPGSRVIDAIKRAGGVTARGLPGSINRAAKLADGQQVVVPENVPVVGAGSGGAGGAGASVSAGGAGAAGSSAGAGSAAPISLGTATAEQLEQIDGIGPVTAADIIEYRDSKGGLSSIDQLDQVSGIGPVTMEALRSGLQP